MEGTESGEVEASSSEATPTRAPVGEESGCPPEDDSAPMDISLIEGPPTATATEETRKAFRYPNRAPFYFGINITHEEAVKRKAAREKRFGLEDKASKDLECSVERREARAKRFGTKLVATDDGEPIKLVDSLPDIPDAKVRPEAVHLHGTDDMSTRDVFSYFRLYAPRNIEWVNDHSCNVVWEDRSSASRALLGLGRQPVARRSGYESYIPPVTLSTGATSKTDQNQIGEGEADPNQARNQTQASENHGQNHTEGSGEEDRIQTQLEGNTQNQSAGSSLSLSHDKEGSKDTEESSSTRGPESSPMAMEEGEFVEGEREKVEGEEEEEGKEEGKKEEEEEEEGAKVYPALQWRYGGNHPKAKVLLLRWATELDVKQKGAAKNSVYYFKYGRPPVPGAIIAAQRKERRKGEEEEEEEEEGENVEEMQDLRSRIGKRTIQEECGNEEGEVREEGEVMEDKVREEGEVMEDKVEEEAMDANRSSDDPFACLSKRPRTLYSDRMYSDRMVDAADKSEGERVLAEVGGDTWRVGRKNDLRRALQQRKKRRNLKLRIGYHPRLVEEKQ